MSSTKLDNIVVFLSIVFPFAMLTNVILAVMMAKMKREKEQDVFDRKRHVDVLHISQITIDVLGSCLIYPTLIYVLYKAAKRVNVNNNICTFLNSVVSFYISCIVNLTTAINIHGIYSAIWPLKFFIYLRIKHSKIPLLCVAVSLLVGLVSLILSTCDYSFYRLKAGTNSNETACVPELQDSSVVYFYVVIVYVAYWLNIAAFICILTRAVTRSNWRKRSANIKKMKCCLLPGGAAFQLSFRMIFVVTWTPFVVVTTIMLSSHNVSTDVILSSSYVVFSSALLSPFVFYVAHGDVRSVFHSSIKRLCSNIKSQRHTFQEKPDLGLENQAVQSSIK